MIYFYIVSVIILLLLLSYCCFYKKINIFLVALTGKKRIQKKLYKECKANDFLILNDIYLPVGDNKYKHIDTIIFANKYVYIIKEIKQLGEVKISVDDLKWRVIYHNSLELIDNPLISNRKIIKQLTNVVEGLESNDLKSMVVLSKTCYFNPLNFQDNEFVVGEKDVIKTINEIEKNSNDDIIDPFEVERYCNSFYEYGLKVEKLLKSKGKKE